MSPGFVEWVYHQTEALNTISDGIRQLERSLDVRVFWKFSEVERAQCILFRGVVVALKATVDMTRRSLENIENELRETQNHIELMRQQRSEPVRKRRMPS